MENNKETDCWDIVIPAASKGGVENCINIIAKELIRLGHKIRVVQLISENDKWLDDEVPFYELTYGKDGHNTNELAEKYANFLLENSLPSVIIATNWPLCVYIIKMSLAICGKKIPVLSWVHSPVERYFESGFGGYEYLGLADGHLAISNYIYSGLHSNLENPIVYRVNNPVIPAKTRKDEKCRSEEINHRLAFVGRITVVKGLDIILKALSLSKSKWTVDVVGETEDEEYKSYIYELIDSYQLRDRIKLWGWQESPWEVLENIDFLCMPSIYEGFSLVAIEALARGIPVISTAVGIVVEIVSPGETGYFISQQNAQELADILDCIDRGALPIPTKDKCKSVVLPRFTYYSVVAEFEEAVESLCRKFTV